MNLHNREGDLCRGIPDPLTSFSHRIVQIKFIVLELAMLLVFLTWVWGKVKHDIMPEPPPPSAATQHDSEE